MEWKGTKKRIIVWIVVLMVAEVVIVLWPLLCSALGIGVWFWIPFVEDSKTIAYCLYCGLTGGLTIGLAVGLEHGLAYGLAFGLALGLASSFCPVLGSSFIVGLGLIAGLSLGLTVGFAGGLASVSAGDLAGRLALGLALGLGFDREGAAAALGPEQVVEQERHLLGAAWLDDVEIGHRGERRNVAQALMAMARRGGDQPGERADIEHLRALGRIGVDLLVRTSRQEAAEGMADGHEPLERHAAGL